MSYFEEQLNSDQSINELRQLIDGIYVWMDRNHYHNEQTLDRFDLVRARLDDQSKNVLFLAEFSRGKSELINATIFGSKGSRYLPSTPGRTTKCTTILQYDDAQLPSIKLLPTTTGDNIHQQSLSMLENHPAWVQSLFSLSDHDAIKNELKKITEEELVTPKKAVELGFLKDVKKSTLENVGLVEGLVPVPKWRHSIVNYPHPLFKQGLRIVDTPGLNALGVEPELTLQAIDSAHAIVFVLSADIGITRSELEMWRNHIQDNGTDNVIVVLNKVDLLWDELKTHKEIHFDVNKQIKDVAHILGIPTSQIYPVSAQKALVARARDNNRLLDASGMLRYEQALADTINFSSQRRIVSKTSKELSPSLNSICNGLKRRIHDADTHIHELNELHDSQTSVAKNSTHKVKRDIEKHAEARKYIVALKKELNEGYANFVRRLDILFLDRMINSYRYEISSQLTTSGLQREMNDFQTVAADRFKLALSYIVRLERRISKTYQKVESILEIEGLTPRKIEPETFIESLKKFQESHEKYSKGIGMIMTEQHILRNRYHSSVMVKVRNLYKQTREDVDRWCRTVLVPLELEMKDRAGEIKRRKSSLDRIKSKDVKVLDEIGNLQVQRDEAKKQLSTMEHFMQRIQECGDKSSKMPENVIKIHRNSPSSMAG